MRIGEVAKRVGVCADTIRTLERKGLIAPRRDWNGHRRFSPSDLERLEEVIFRKNSKKNKLTTNPLHA